MKHEPLPAERTPAIERLMEVYGTKVLHTAYYHLKDRQLAEDVAQEVFTKAYQHWDTFRGDSSPYTWLYRITVNLCRDKVRSAWWRRLSFFGEAGDGQQGMEQQALPEDGPEEAALKNARHGAVKEAVMSLPEAYREVVLLFYFEDLPTREIAQVTGQNENTVKTKLFRARALMRDSLQRKGVEP